MTFADRLQAPPELRAQTAGRDAHPVAALMTSPEMTRPEMPPQGPLEVRAGLASHLARLWRYGLVLSGRADMAEDLVQMTCVRALERARQFLPGTRLDRWLFAILRSIWLNEARARRVREGQGAVAAEETLTFDGVKAIETNILARQVLKEVQLLPQAQRETLFLVYVEGFAYREAAAALDVPIGTVMSRLAAARRELAGRTGDTAGARSSGAND